MENNEETIKLNRSSNEMIYIMFIVAIALIRCCDHEVATGNCSLQNSIKDFGLQTKKMRTQLSLS